MTNNYHLILSCPDQCGIVAAISQLIATQQGTIVEADHHTDLETQRFFMRYEIGGDTFRANISQFQQALLPILDHFQMDCRFIDTQHKKRVLILASKSAHCLEGLLYHWKSGELDCEIVGVASNHDDLRARTEFYQLPFHHFPIDTDKSAHFANIQNLITSTGADVIVLARYMQILPTALCEQYAGQMINIHHSFLPSFVGAKPYHQAYARGVKLIGATGHYVTADLDEGPIIEQDVVRITHRQRLKDYIAMGQEVERKVLTKALRAHLEDRVIVCGNKTVVLS